MARSSVPPAPAAPAFDRVTVLGGGPEGRLLACLCLAEGAEVTLFSAYGAELAAIRAAGGTTLRGAGPVGTFPAGREDGPSIRLSAELDAALDGAELVFVTGPVLKQRTYAMVLAEHVADGQVLALVPGRFPRGARGGLVPEGRRLRGGRGPRRSAGALLLDPGGRRDPSPHPRASRSRRRPAERPHGRGAGARPLSARPRPCSERGRERLRGRQRARRGAGAPPRRPRGSARRRGVAPGGRASPGARHVPRPRRRPAPGRNRGDGARAARGGGPFRRA